MNEKSFKSMVRLRKQFAKLYAEKGAGLIGIAEDYVQVQEAAFAFLCFNVLGVFRLDIKGGTVANDPKECRWIQLRVIFDETEFHSLGSAPEWDAVGFPMTEAILYAQADRELDYIPAGKKDPGFWSIVLAHLVFLMNWELPEDEVQS